MSEIIFDKQITSIDIVLENCEEFNIPAECVQYFYAVINEKTIRIQNYSSYAKAYQSESLFASYFKIIITNVDQINGSTMMGSKIGEKFSERIYGNDIAQIHIHYDDNSIFWFYVPWNYENEYKNSYQYTKQKDDKIYIIISKDKPEDWDGNENELEEETK